ncbi:FMN-binding protein [Novipirellula artificiosorum]|uniref:Electron transport complex subunit RsxG n=1 Tax=Novipirellula artificiosorum TaxID=2528016 RepID=A0A5C6DGM8_9BACT|nr:FMN-binding protein [Novipirellula artificiosorum]TWU35970.1 Electron transport complex subunit RsxG [Novipirellula artificiosorum]
MKEGTNRSRIDRPVGFLFAVCLLGICPVNASATEDWVEMLSGVKAKGKVTSIRQAEKEFDFEVTLGNQTRVNTFAFSQVHAVTIDGKRHVLTEKHAVRGETRVIRSESELLALIDSAGRTPPDWFASTPLDYPNTLDVSWPMRPPNRQWNNQANVGQYLWDIIYPNPSRWRSGTRLVHHEMTLHKHSPELLARDMQTLGRMYFQLFQDYPRAAFWLRQLHPLPNNNLKIELAECYWRLGCESMAMELLAASPLPVQAIKLLGDMGQTDRAIQLGKSALSTSQAHAACMLAGDACRQAGRYPDAIQFYEQVLSLPHFRNPAVTDRFHSRAKDSIEAIRLVDQADVRNVADGTYRDSSIGYTGPVDVEVVVSDHRIDDIRVTRHTEKQFYAALTDTPKQILAKQSVQGIDGTTGATITSQAIVNATAKALAKGNPK